LIFILGLGVFTQTANSQTINWELPVFEIPAGSWLLTSAGGSFNQINGSTIILRTTPFANNSGFLYAEYFNPIITSVSFDWVLTDDNPGNESSDFVIQAGYCLGDASTFEYANFDLFTGASTTQHSGSVFLANLDLKSFGFSTGVTGCSSKLEITNLNFTVIPEPASYGLVGSFVLLFAAVAKIGARCRSRK